MYRRPVLSSPDGNNKNSMMAFVVWFPLNLSCLFLYWWTFPKQKNKLSSWQWNHMSFKNEEPLSRHHHFLPYFPQRVRPKPEFSFCTAILVRGKFTVRFTGKLPLWLPICCFFPGLEGTGQITAPASALRHLKTGGFQKTTKTRDLVEENAWHLFLGLLLLLLFHSWCDVFFLGPSDAVFVFQIFCSFVKNKYIFSPRSFLIF